MNKANFKLYAVKLYDLANKGEIDKFEKLLSDLLKKYQI